MARINNVTRRKQSDGGHIKSRACLAATGAAISHVTHGIATHIPQAAKDGFEAGRRDGQDFVTGLPYAAGATVGFAFGEHKPSSASWPRRSTVWSAGPPRRLAAATGWRTRPTSRPISCSSVRYQRALNETSLGQEELRLLTPWGIQPCLSLPIYAGAISLVVSAGGRRRQAIIRRVSPLRLRSHGQVTGRARRS